MVVLPGRFVPLAVDLWVQTQQEQGKNVDIALYSDQHGKG